MTTERAYRQFMAVVAVIMLAWAVAYGYLNYKTDDCLSGIQDRLNSLQLRIDQPR